MLNTRSTKKGESLQRILKNEEISGVIDEGCEFEGKLSFEGTVRIGGVFRGEVYTEDTLVVAETALIEGDISAGVVILNGKMKGTIRARDRVEIHNPARFAGKIYTPSLQVDEGVLFEGETHMTKGALEE